MAFDIVAVRVKRPKRSSFVVSHKKVPGNDENKDYYNVTAKRIQPDAYDEGKLIVSLVILTWANRHADYCMFIKASRLWRDGSNS